MNVETLDGKIVKWKMDGQIAWNDTRPRSSNHIVARKIIKNKYPTLQLLEEVPIPVKTGSILYLDFFLPKLNIAYEVNGEQHYKFSSLYHGNKMDFIKQQKRDREKKSWCELNGIQLIVLTEKDLENESRNI